MSKFKVGDRVKLTCRGNRRDVNYGVEGLVVGHVSNCHGEQIPIVELCDGFEWSDHYTRRFDWFEDDWWTLVDTPGECYCSSLL